MRRRSTIVFSATMLFALISAACSGLAGGPRKVVLNEAVCANAKFLRLKLNATNRLVLDNSKYNAQQSGMSITLDKFPVTIIGEVPQGSSVGDVASTILLSAGVGEKKQVDLRPNLTGTYSATCGVNFKTGNGGLQVQQRDLQFQITQ
ncbi:MAG: hypothetical protein HYX50_03635 [Chloroflexi bacterium]|nr:hypothetical protein [Chloroflexota bacterium]